MPCLTCTQQCSGACCLLFTSGISILPQALADMLKAQYRGFFLPPRPEKNPVEGQRASEEFVEVRRVALEKYLNQLAAHPAVVRSEVRPCSWCGVHLA